MPAHSPQTRSAASRNKRRQWTAERKQERGKDSLLLERTRRARWEVGEKQEPWEHFWLLSLHFQLKVPVVHSRGILSLWCSGDNHGNNKTPTPLSSSGGWYLPTLRKSYPFPAVNTIDLRLYDSSTPDTNYSFNTGCLIKPFAHFPVGLPIFFLLVSKDFYMVYRGNLGDSDWCSLYI